MFKQILAVDISNRIPNFLERIKDYSKNSPIILASSLEPINFEANSIDALSVSIYESLPKEFLERFHNLTHIFVLGTSPKRIDREYCQKNHIKIITVKEYCDHETAEWVIWQLLNIARSKNHSLYEKKLGVIGAGGVGSKVIKTAISLGMKVFYDAANEHRDLEELGAIKKSKSEIFALCDFISLHTPADTELIDKSILKNAKREQVIVNTVMGAPINIFALKNFIEAKPDIKIFMDEVAGRSYQDIKNLVNIVPQIAYFTEDSQKRLYEKFFHNIKAAFMG